MGASYSTLVNDSYESYQSTSLAQALDDYEGVGHWGMLLFKHTSKDEDWGFELILDVSPPTPKIDSPLGTIVLSLPSLPPPDESHLGLYDYFRAILFDISETSNATYGWSAGSLGLFGAEVESIDEKSVIEVQPQPLEWLNIYGRPYVERIGLTRLASAPAWRVEFLANGSIAVALGESPRQVSHGDARLVAGHLGVPVIIPRPCPDFLDRLSRST